MVEKCVRCNVNGDEVRLFDAVYEGKMGSLCERCSIIENIPIIKKPNASQLRESEKGLGVYSRMRRLTGIRDSQEEDTFFVEDKLKELDENPSLETPEKNKLNLIEHFHWEIMKNRRRKGLSQKQLAETLGESEVVIQMIEAAKFPENAEQLITKLEQFFQVKLRNISDTERFLQTYKEKPPVLLDRDGKELLEIPEPKIEQKDIEEIDIEEIDVEKMDMEEIELQQKLRKEQSISEFLEGAEKEVKSEPNFEHETQIEEFGEPEIRELPDEEEIDLGDVTPVQGINEETGEFEIRKSDLSDVRISDLKELHRKKIEVTKKEQLEEQRKIEERSRMIEARKEELRLMKERESNELDRVLGGTELLDVGNTIKKLEDEEEVKEFEEELR